MGDATAVDLADEVVDVVLLPGTHLPERLHDPLHAEIVFDTARALERVPELLASDHTSCHRAAATRLSMTAGNHNRRSSTETSGTDPRSGRSGAS